MKLPSLASILIVGVTSSVTLAADDGPSIEELLKTGGQIAGYSKLR